MTPVDWFDNLRCWDNQRNKWLETLKWYGIWNHLVMWIANIFLPIYFRCTSSDERYSLGTQRPRSSRIVVSLTSYPQRLFTLWLVLETILRQRVQPDVICVYLTRSQVPSEKSLPKSLIRMKSRGVKFVFCPDKIRSHSKYFYAMKEFPEECVITVDDDLFYRSDLIENLLECHKLYPHAIITNWAKKMKPRIRIYNQWPDMKQAQITRMACLLGVSGVLYPPQAIAQEAFDVESIREISLTSDDLWLSYMAILNGTSFYYTAYAFHHLPVMIANKSTLLADNRNGGNQKCIDKIFEKYGSRLDACHLCL
jgi:hypothetical protein